jgi:FkbM family methyltransferase
MRIAILTNNARAAGGVESYLDTLIPLLEAAGNQIALLCDLDAPSTSRPISRSTAVPLWTIAELGVPHARDSLRSWRPDLIYTHGLSNSDFEGMVPEIAPAIAFIHDYSATCISGAKAFSFPSTTPCLRPLGPGCFANFYPRRCGGLNPLTTVTDFRRAARWLEQLRNFRAVLTASKFVRDELIRNGLPPSLVHCIGLPVADRSAAQPASPEPSTDVPASTTLRLLFAGRLERLKGGQVLLDALPLVSSALSRPLTLTFAGDGRAHTEWMQRADLLMRHHPGLRVEFVGRVEADALTTLFDASDLLVVPSLWPEPFGLVGPEAGMRGLPAVAFAVGGIPEWLSDGVNGALAAGHSPGPADLADAVVRCLRDPADQAQLRRGAYQMARRFSPERHLTTLMNLFQGMPVHSVVAGSEAASHVETTLSRRHGTSSAIMSKFFLRVIDYLPRRLTHWVLQKRSESSILRHMTTPFANVFRNKEVEIGSGLGKGLFIDVGASAAAYALGTFKPDLQSFLSSAVKQGSVFYDIGANVGFFSLLAARLVGPQGRVFSFEPLPENVLKLHKNVARNQFHNVQILPLALGATNEEQMFQVSERPTWGKLRSVGSDTPDKYLTDIKVTVRRLDDLLGEGQIAAPDFMKLDVEGAEVEIVQGAAETLSRHGPILMIELHGTGNLLTQTLAKIGYCALPLNNRFPDVVEAHWNAMILAFPSDRANSVDAVKRLLMH